MAAAINPASLSMHILGDWAEAELLDLAKKAPEIVPKVISSYTSSDGQRYRRLLVILFGLQRIVAYGCLCTGFLLLLVAVLKTILDLLALRLPVFLLQEVIYFHESTLYLQQLWDHSKPICTPAHTLIATHLYCLRP